MSFELSSLKMEALEAAYANFRKHGYALFPSQIYRDLVGLEAREQIAMVCASFSDLKQDRFMGDGGVYRYRAYSKFSLYSDEKGEPVLEALDGNSIFQAREDNPVNGGVVRTFAPVAGSILNGSLLRALITWDFRHAFACDKNFFTEAVAVGVHQVRIVARTGAIGHPAPEGIHRDRERFTFQHFMGRYNIDGGEFRVHDENQRVEKAWMQQECLDTAMFQGSTWHSATPISIASPSLGEGYRDIFLIDFDPIS